jgi:hypothetical protein
MSGVALTKQFYMFQILFSLGQLIHFKIYIILDNGIHFIETKNHKKSSIPIPFSHFFIKNKHNQIHFPTKPILRINLLNFKALTS